MFSMATMQRRKICWTDVLGTFAAGSIFMYGPKSANGEVFSSVTQKGFVARPSARTGGGSSRAVGTRRSRSGTRRRARKRSRSRGTRRCLAWPSARTASGSSGQWGRDGEGLGRGDGPGNAHAQGHTEAVDGVAFSPDGKRIVVGSSDKTVKVWDAATGQETLDAQGAHGSGVAAWPSARTASGSSRERDKTVKVWDAATGQEMLTLKGHTGGVRSVAFSPDGKRIVIGQW